MVNGERVRQAREIRGLTQAQLAGVVGVHQSNIARLEQQLFVPTAPLIEAIAVQTDFPIDFFFQGSAPDFPLGTLLFRKRQSLKSAEKAQIRQLARLNFELFESISGKFNAYEVRLPRLTESPTLAAKIARSVLGYSPDVPITDLIRRLERNGVVALALPCTFTNHDAFSLWADTDPRKPTIIITAGKPGDRTRFSVAHELGHLVLHQAFQGSRAQIEEEADSFAAEFLLPRETLKKEFSLPVTLTSLADLKKRWGVSIQALLRRARDVGVVNERQYKYIHQQISMRGWKLSEPIDVEPEKPRLFRKMVELIHGSKSNPDAVARNINAPPRLVEQILACYAAPVETKRQPVNRMQNIIPFRNLEGT